MTKLNYLFITVFLMFSLISCDKDDDSNELPKINTTEAQVKGKWNMINYSVLNGKTTTSTQGTNLSISYTQEASNIDYITIFSTNPNVASSEGSFDVTIKTTIPSQTIFEQTIPEQVSEQTIPFSSDDISGSGTVFGNSWKLVDGNKLRITNNQTTFDYIITAISENSMTLNADLSMGNTFINNSLQTPSGTTTRLSGNLIIELSLIER